MKVICFFRSDCRQKTLFSVRGRDLNFLLQLMMRLPKHFRPIPFARDFLLFEYGLYFSSRLGLLGEQFVFLKVEISLVQHVDLWNLSEFQVYGGPIILMMGPTVCWISHWNGNFAGNERLLNEVHVSALDLVLVDQK